MKKIKIYKFLLISLMAAISVSFTPPAQLNIQVKFSIFSEDPTRREIEFSTACKDCGKVFIYIDGKYAGQIDVKFRDRTILVKPPGSYQWVAKNDAGLIEEGTVDCP